MSASAVSDALNAMLSDDAVRDRMRAGDSTGFDLNAEERDLVRSAAADCPANRRSVDGRATDCGRVGPGLAGPGRVAWRRAGCGPGTGMVGLLVTGQSGPG